MSTAARLLRAEQAGWPIRDDDPFADGGRLPAGVDASTLSRFGDARWDLSPLNTGGGHHAAASVNWELFGPRRRASFRRAGWALVNLPIPEELLQRTGSNRVKWPSAATMQYTFVCWRRFDAWLTGKGIGDLREVTEDDLEDYAAHLTRLQLSPASAAGALYAVSLVWGFAPHLLAQDRLPLPPWETHGVKDYLPATVKTNENSTAPIHPAVMSPLLIWAMRFIDDFAEDILTAWAERQRLVGRIRQDPNPEAHLTLRQLFDRYRAENRPLPGAVYRGRHVVARTYLAGLTSASPGQVRRAVTRRAGDLPVAAEAALDTRINGVLHGQPWKPHITFHEAPGLMVRLATASMIVALYLSGMRPGEGLELPLGCCPEPEDDGTGPLHYKIRGNFFKNARDQDGRLIPGGLPRQIPWTVIAPTVRAIRVLERMAEGRCLFPAAATWISQSAGHRKRAKRTGQTLSCAAANGRVAAFIRWVNEFADQNGLGTERIPDDPDGPVVLSRLRRTVAWHIARLPTGRIALATQYGHLRTSAVTEGYSGRARAGLRRVLDIETARAMADYLDDLAERVNRGEGVSGPAATRMIKAAQDVAARFEGMFLTPKQAAALRAEPQFQVYDNPDAFLTCNHDPAKALCHPERTGRAKRDLPPAIDRCDPACANIARTDTHIARAREEISRLADEINDPLTPMPLRERLKQRVTALQQIVDRHEQTRIIPAEETADDR